MKRVEIDSDINPFFDATERFLIKFRTYDERKQLYEKYQHLYRSEEINSLHLFEEYLIEVDMLSEFPFITITPKQELLERLKNAIEFFENSVL